ncbi:hypothetical protein DOTSEDRAFT_32789 [Dothistroma septosporum NZE10]|uniref:Uncharacterized protein n=1 Tax=Dothistroma septosporum (strain NZE10 / CBS 128990) TaxID=675120 RepID=N1PRQ0_DOTSN|nr:hypothetical protein DOTSEDRAFT_32789 [Dothistroma septosporum NZE10]
MDTHAPQKVSFTSRRTTLSTGRRAQTASPDCEPTRASGARGPAPQLYLVAFSRDPMSGTGYCAQKAGDSAMPSTETISSPSRTMAFLDATEEHSIIAGMHIDDVSDS